MNIDKVGMCLAACLWASAAPVLAHHSVAGQFDSDERVTLTGVISKVDWINPHTYLHIDVHNDDGSMTTWEIASLPTAMMRKAGLSSELLKGDGSPVTVVAIRARDGTQNLGWLLRIDYAAGHHYQFGAVD